MTLQFRMFLVCLFFALGLSFATGVFAVLSLEQRFIMCAITLLHFGAGFALGRNK